MSQVAMQSCPHCGAGNQIGSEFCASCGKALPSAAPSGPRILGAKDLASTAAGQKLQGDELLKQAKRASGALLAAAIIGTIVPILTFVAIKSDPRLVVDPVGMGILVVIAAIFWGLWVWSRTAPLPAAIIGLVLYVTYKAFIVITNVIWMSQNPSTTTGRGGGFGGIGIGWLDLVVIGVLIQAIGAGAKHRKLIRQGAL